MTWLTTWRKRRGCFHHDHRTGASWIQSSLVDLGRAKHFWCMKCGLSWCYSARNRSWFAVVRVDDDTMRIHRCRLNTAPAATWREVRRGSPPSAEYLAVRASLSRTDTEEETP